MSLSLMTRRITRLAEENLQLQKDLKDLRSLAQQAFDLQHGKFYLPETGKVRQDGPTELPREAGLVSAGRATKRETRRMILTDQIRADLINAIDAALVQYETFPMDPKFRILKEDELAYVRRLRTIRDDLVTLKEIMQKIR